MLRTCSVVTKKQERREQWPDHLVRAGTNRSLEGRREVCSRLLPPKRNKTAERTFTDLKLEMELAGFSNTVTSVFLLIARPLQVKKR
jgi:hypothetical protein